MASLKRLSTLNHGRSFSEDLSESGDKCPPPGQDLSSDPCVSSGIVQGTALPAAVSAPRRRTAPSPTPIFSTSPSAPLRTLRWEGSAPWTDLLIASLAPAEWKSEPEKAHRPLRTTHRWVQHCGHHPDFENKVRPEGQLSSSPPSLIRSLIPLSNNMADNTPVAACVLQQKYGLFETMDSTLKGRALNEY